VSLILLFIVTACQNNEDQINGNIVTDTSAEIPIKESKEEAVELTETCSNECSADSCIGLSHISCTTGEDGCKHTLDKGKNSWKMWR